MHNELRTFFDHSRHKLRARGIDALLDVLAFQGEERCQDASFSLHNVSQKLPFLGLSVPEVKPLRMVRPYAVDPHGLPLIPGTEVAEKAQAAAKSFARRKVQA